MTAEGHSTWCFGTICHNHSSVLLLVSVNVECFPHAIISSNLAVDLKISERAAMCLEGCVIRLTKGWVTLCRLLLDGKVPQDAWLLEDPSLKEQIQAYADNEEAFVQVLGKLRSSIFLTVITSILQIQ